jgi:hypothetical protein
MDWPQTDTATLRTARTAKIIGCSKYPLRLHYLDSNFYP